MRVVIFLFLRAASYYSRVYRLFHRTWLPDSKCIRNVSLIDGSLFIGFFTCKRPQRFLFAGAYTKRLERFLIAAKAHKTP
jgi:hypothetical protein